MKLKFMFLELKSLHCGNRWRMPVAYKLIVTPGPLDDRMFMACVGGKPLTGGYLDYGEPYGNEELGLITLAQLLIGILEDLSRRSAHLCTVLDEVLGLDHKQCCRYSLAGYIRHDKCQMIIIHQEKVIEITTDFLGRIHGRIEVKLGLCTVDLIEVTRQHAGLDIGGYREFTGYTLLLRSHVL